MSIDIDKIRRSVGLIGESDQIHDMLTTIGQVAGTDIIVLVNGESGSGKEMVANAIHKNSKRKFESMITVNCAAIPAGTIESELFGHKKGSFTGASENRKGYFEAADKGTIFLDEIGEMPIETQAKLLRVIEQKEFIRVGDAKAQKTDVRIIVATNRDLYSEVKKGNFRQDLYFRLKTITVNVPPLREHVDDISLFVERFGLEFTAKNDISFKGFTSDAIQLMKKFSWPGNVRELKNTVESLIVMNKGERITNDMVKLSLGIDDYNADSSLPVYTSDSSDKVERELILKQLLFLRQDVNDLKQILLRNGSANSAQVEPSNPALYLPVDGNKDYDSDISIDEGNVTGVKDNAVGELTLEEIEQEIIEKTLRKFKSNRRKTAKALNISERTSYRKINEYGMDKKKTSE